MDSPIGLDLKLAKIPPLRYLKFKTLGDYSKGVFGGSSRAHFDSFRSSPTGLST